MTSSYHHPPTTPSPAQTVPKANASAGGGFSSFSSSPSTSGSSAVGNMSNGSQSFYDDHDNQLLHVNSARVSSAAASSAPGPGLNNGTATEDMQMRWWW
ncbi:hypothetical protein KR009_009131 [Drosophila setifemur]|nr:hypothetical protein KR009_009131 [Drosophila setifemur]